MMGNAMIQPTMYFNLRHVPMFSGPYMIQKVNHTIGPGTFETIIEGIRQPTAELPKIENYIQVLKQKLLKSILEKVKEEHLPASPKFSFLGALIEYGFDRQLVEDWLKVRKTKKATNTQTAFNKFIEEVEQRSCNINEILEICVEKSWSGFKWTWVDNLKQTNTFNNGRVEKTPEQLASDIFNSETARNFRFS
jgi:hypothetical protein